MGKHGIPPVERFWARVEKTSGCWNWTGPLHGGDGTFDGTGAHRAAFQFVRGNIPEGLHLDHLCRNKACVNPEHLEPVTKRENTLRAVPFRWRNEIKNSRLKNFCLTVKHKNVAFLLHGSKKNKTRGNAMVLVDMARFEVKVGNRLVTLSPKEFDILAVLAYAKGVVLSRESIISQIGGRKFDLRTVDQHVARLRKSLKDDRKVIIQTSTTRGYKAVGVSVVQS